MATNRLSVYHTNDIHVRLVEAQDGAQITVNDRHFALRTGMTLDIMPSLCEGINIITFFVVTDSIKNDPSRLLAGRYEWSGTFEIYIDGEIVGSYSKRGVYLIGGKKHSIGTVEVNMIKDVSQPTVMRLINEFQRVLGMTDADKSDCSKSHPHILFKNGITIHRWKNYAGVDHAFITDRSGKCVYGGYVGWAHSQNLQAALERLHQELEEYIV